MVLLMKKSIQFLLVVFTFTTIFCGSVPLVAQNVIPTENIDLKPNEVGAAYFAGNLNMPLIVLSNTAQTFVEVTTTSNEENLGLIFSTNDLSAGIGEVIIQYYSVGDPSFPKTKKYIIQVATSFVKTQKDFITVSVNSLDTLINVLANDAFQTNEYHLSAIISSNSGIASLNADSSQVVYQPKADFKGMSYVTYLACDGNEHCDIGELIINVIDTNEIYENELISIYTTKNVPIELPLSGQNFTLILQGSNGFASALSEEVYLYEPIEDFVGTDTVIFQHDLGAERLFVISIFETFERYHAIDDKAFTRPDSSITFNVLENDVISHPISSTTNPDKGYIVLGIGGEITYVPNSGFIGVDKFTYTTCFGGDIYCETANVEIHVGHLYPNISRTYKFKTPKNLKLPIYYKIPFQDYVNNGSVDPDPGLLINYPEFEGNIPMNGPDGCDNSISGYNMLVYAPGDDFVGTDYFSFYHSATGTGLGTLVEVEVEVFEPIIDIGCPCFEDCVWAGDTNEDGIVNMEDLLTLGWNLGDYGPSRSTLELGKWYGENGADWMLTQPFTGKNIKHIDSDGNGAITSMDTIAISEQYYNLNALIPTEQNNKAPYKFKLKPVAFSLDSGSLVIIDILIGDEDNPVVDMHGLSFSLNLPPWMMDSSSVRIDFHENSWLSAHGTSLDMTKVPYDGKVDAGFTRAQGNVVSGYGPVATLSFIVEDDLAGIRSDDNEITFSVTLNDGISYSSTGERLEIPGDKHEFTVKIVNEEDDSPYDLAKSVLLYPNPTADQLNIYVNGENTIYEVQLYALSGQLILSEKFDGIQYNSDISRLQSGLYLVKIVTEKGAITKKLEKF